MAKDKPASRRDFLRPVERRHSGDNGGPGVVAGDYRPGAGGGAEGAGYRK